MLSTGHAPASTIISPSVRNDACQAVRAINRHVIFSGPVRTGTQILNCPFEINTILIAAVSPDQETFVDAMSPRDPLDLAAVCSGPDGQLFDRQRK
jgi:hypothetical protein